MTFKKIAIIVAMEKELNLLLPMLSDRKCVEIDGYAFHTGVSNNTGIIAMKSGIGKVNAALATLALIENFQPDLVISTGVAGGTGAGAGILDIVVADRVAFHDVWCGPGTEWGQAAGFPKFFTSDSRVTTLPALTESDCVHHGLICSGDFFVSSPDEVKVIKERFPDVLAVEMESGAIAQVCYRKGVPYFCLRVVSDTPGADENISQYNDFWEQAPQHTFEMLRSIISELNAI